MKLSKTLSVFLLLALLVTGDALAVKFEWVTVDGPGNACDVQPDGCFGGVFYRYQISKYEVTNAQYAEFLNAIAATNENLLYDTLGMGSSFGGIIRSGSWGSYSYSLIAGRENLPVNRISFYRALRFINWMHNGQPTTRVQDNTTTEDGVYTITFDGFLANSITRNVGAVIFLPSEDEWYKAAYYDPGSTSYFRYPASGNPQTLCRLPGSDPNTANCASAVGDLVEVGSYTGSMSPTDTVDQAGNVVEWTEAVLGSERVLRGGSVFAVADEMAASYRDGFPPDAGHSYSGFRVASVDPALTPSLGPIGLGVLLSLVGLMSVAGLRRKRWNGAR